MHPSGKIGTQIGRVIQIKRRRPRSGRRVTSRNDLQEKQKQMRGGRAQHTHRKDPRPGSRGLPVIIMYYYAMLCCLPATRLPRSSTLPCPAGSARPGVGFWLLSQEMDVTDKTQRGLHNNSNYSRGSSKSRISTGTNHHKSKLEKSGRETVCSFSQKTRFVGRPVFWTWAKQQERRGPKIGHIMHKNRGACRRRSIVSALDSVIAINPRGIRVRVPHRPPKPFSGMTVQTELACSCCYC